jgi:protein-ribulosamine 3-kinase
LPWEAHLSGDGGFGAIARELGAQMGSECAPEPQTAVSGGSIHRSYRWRCGDAILFVKVADDGDATLAAEAAGLEALAKSQAVRVPRVMARGTAGRSAFLAMEWIESRPAGRAAEHLLGVQLAAQHRVTAAQFGFATDNFIGRMPQPNGRLPDWTEFFRERRLRHQLALSAQRSFAPLLEQSGARLLESVGALLAGHRPQASLLHGDLWAGNWLASVQDEPVVFDPAVYYGDREADLAMTHLFGGFGRAFYEAYETEAPLPAGHAVRAELYNLYHLLNHANLFGGGYARQARASIDRLLAEVRG